MQAEKKWSDPSSSIIFFEGLAQINGTATSQLGSISVAASFWGTVSHDGSENKEVRNVSQTNNSTATIGDVTLQLNGYQVKWESVTYLYAKQGEIIGIPHIHQPEYWLAQGIVLKNGQLLGTVQFDGEVVPETTGPKVILQLVGGTSVELFKPINYP